MSRDAEPSLASKQLADAIVGLYDIPLPSSADEITSALRDRGYRPTGRVWNNRHTVLVGEFASAIPGIDGSWAVERSEVALLNVYGCQSDSSDATTLATCAAAVDDLVSTALRIDPTREAGVTVWSTADRTISLQTHGKAAHLGMVHASIEPSP